MGVGVIKARGELLSPTNIVNLTATFYNQFGAPSNTTGFPQIAIVQPSGGVLLSPTSAGVQQIGVGQYLFQYTVGFDGPLGVYNDVWQGNVNGAIQTQTLSFVVTATDQPQLVNDGYIYLGDDPGFHYSQCAISNINKLLKSLKARLNSSGKSKTTDSYGNVVYVDCDIFSIEMLTTFIATAVTDFNQIPYFSSFTLEDTNFISQFFDILVEGATIQALASQALIERGREINITDNGVTFTPPSISEILQTQYTTQLTNYYDKLKYIKNSLRPAGLGLGTFRISGLNPAYKALSHLRERRII